MFFWNKILHYKLHCMVYVMLEEYIFNAQYVQKDANNKVIMDFINELFKSKDSTTKLLYII